MKRFCTTWKDRRDMKRHEETLVNMKRHEETKRDKKTRTRQKIKTKYTTCCNSTFIVLKIMSHMKI